MDPFDKPSAPHQLRIAGILCAVAPNEHIPDFVDVFIADGQELLPEWIVRGAITLSDAIRTAEWAIAALRSGHSLIHDSEGRIIPFKILIDPSSEGDAWKSS
jgi:hypothetical protein